MAKYESGRRLVASELRQSALLRLLGEGAKDAGSSSRDLLTGDLIACMGICGFYGV